MIYTKEVEEMCTVARGASHGCAPIPDLSIKQKYFDQHQKSVSEEK